MKPEVHPEYRQVVFQDQSSGDNIIVGSTMATSETITLDGVEYPLAKVELSSRSHPFFTGQMKIVDTAGRVERFERRYGARRKKAGAAPADEAAEAAEAVESPAEETVAGETVAEAAPGEEAVAEAPVEEAEAPAEEAEAPAEEAEADSAAEADES